VVEHLFSFGVSFNAGNCQADSPPLVLPTTVAPFRSFSCGGNAKVSGRCLSAVVASAHQSWKRVATGSAWEWPWASPSPLAPVPAAPAKYCVRQRSCLLVNPSNRENQAGKVDEIRTRAHLTF